MQTARFERRPLRATCRQSSPGSTRTDSNNAQLASADLHAMCPIWQLQEGAAPSEKRFDDHPAGQTVPAWFDGREAATARERERQQQLVREIRSRKGIRREIPS